MRGRPRQPEQSLVARKVGRGKGAPCTGPAAGAWVSRDRLPGRPRLGWSGGRQTRSKPWLSHASRACTRHSSASSFRVLHPAPQSRPEAQRLIRMDKAPGPGCWETRLGTQPSLPSRARHRMDTQAEWTIT